jgi:flagellar motor switch protein FliG
MAEKGRRKRAIDAYRKASARPATDGGADEGEDTPSEGPGEMTLRGNAGPAGRSGSHGNKQPSFEKTTLEKLTSIVGSPEAPAALKDLDRPGGVDRAARLLIALGTEEAAAVLAQLTSDEVEKVTRAIIETERVHRGELAEELAEAAARPAEQVLKGGPVFAREVLIQSFGEDEGERFFLRAVPNAPEHHFSFLAELEPAQLVTLLKDESAPAIAVVLSHLEAQQAADLMKSLSAETRQEVAKRIARLGRLDRNVVIRIEDALKEKIRTVGTKVGETVDGASTLAAILRGMEPESGDEILRALAVADTELADQIREQIITIDVLETITRNDLALLLREFDDDRIALFLKGKSEALRRHVLDAVSERRRVSISEEYRHQGPRLKSDVEEVTHEILERVRQLEEDGVILVPRGDERYI